MVTTSLLKVLRSIALLLVNPVGSVATAPGWNRVTEEKLRPFSGIVEISFELSESPSEPSAVSRIGAIAPLTVTLVLLAVTLR